jgi:hypothetical protein
MICSFAALASRTRPNGEGRMMFVLFALLALVWATEEEEDLVRQQAPKQHQTRKAHHAHERVIRVNAQRVPLVFENYSGAADEQPYGEFVTAVGHYMEAHDCVLHTEDCHQHAANHSVTCTFNCADTSERKWRHMRYDVVKRFRHPKQGEKSHDAENHWDGWLEEGERETRSMRHSSKTRHTQQKTAPVRKTAAVRHTVGKPAIRKQRS